MALNTKITDWANKRVWIVGASTGIGAALANQLHTRNAKVACPHAAPTSLMKSLRDSVPPMH